MNNHHTANDYHICMVEVNVFTAGTTVEVLTDTVWLSASHIALTIATVVESTEMLVQGQWT